MITEIDDLSTPELDPYRNLMDRHLRAREGLFVAEGLEVVRRLLHSTLPVRSLLVTSDKLARLQSDLRPHTPVFVASLAQIEAIAGFNVHRGTLAIGARPANPDLHAAVSAVSANDHPLIVALENVTDAENIGVIIRSAAVFGAGLILMQQCCDPFYRRAVRVSMGNVFRLPICRTTTLAADLHLLREKYGYATVAAVTSPSAIPLADAARPLRTALVFGAEGDGLSDAVQAACSHPVTLPMAPGSDSVNVGVAAGIFLHHYARPG